MKRPREHVLEDESKRALKNLLPAEWIFRDKNPDYGIDMEIEIVEREKVTNKVLWLQMKAAESRRRNQEIFYQMKTNHLKYYEDCHLPVTIVYWIKSENDFYYVFIQRYIRETLSKKTPRWREQKTVRIRFDSKLETGSDLEFIATEGYLYIIQQRLNIGSGGSAYYWLDGIPKSDNEELKERTLKALSLMENENYPAAIDEFEHTLRVCTFSPTEKMSTLLNLGNAHYSLSQYNNVLKDYEAVLELTKNISGKSALEGKSIALRGIGLIYRDRGDIDEALECLEESLKISREIECKQGIAINLTVISWVYRDKGDSGKFMKYLKEASKISREMGYKRNESACLMSIGTYYLDKGDLEKALKYYKEALKISRERGLRLWESVHLGNVGYVYREKGDLDEALKYFENALTTSREIGYKQGEADSLGNIGITYKAKGDLKIALEHLQDALKILDKFGLVQGRDIICSAIDSISKRKQTQ